MARSGRVSPTRVRHGRGTSRTPEWHTGKTPFGEDHWRVWHLDSELRYGPALEVLPADDPRPICEIGSGPSGLAGWTERLVIGIDPGDDERHGLRSASPPNLVRKQASGTSIPVDSHSVAAALAVDTIEHIPQSDRDALISEMFRVTAPGGRVVLVGPAGAQAREGDSWLLETARTATRDVAWVQWLHEHILHGLPSVEELVSSMFDAGATRVRARGVLNIRLWRIMHLAGLGKLPEPRDPLYGLLWRPFGSLARIYHRGPFYRWVVLGDV